MNCLLVSKFGEKSKKEIQVESLENHFHFVTDTMIPRTIETTIRLIVPSLTGFT